MVGGVRGADPDGGRFQPEDRHTRLHARRSYRVIDLLVVIFRFPPATGESGRPDQGVPLRADDDGRLTHRDRSSRPARVAQSFVLDATNDQLSRPCSICCRSRYLRADHGRWQSARSRRQARAQKRGCRWRYLSHHRRRSGPRRWHRQRHPAAASGEMEKTIKFDFALLLRDKIEKAGKYRVVMTRLDDTFVPLADRVAFARAQQASLFISIHADAAARGGRRRARGQRVFIRCRIRHRILKCAAGRDREPGGRDRGAHLRAQRCGRHPHRSRPARNQDIFRAVRARAHRLHANSDADAQEFAQSGRLGKPRRRTSLPSSSSLLACPNKQDIKSLTSADWREHVDLIAQAIDRFDDQAGRKHAERPKLSQGGRVGAGGVFMQFQHKNGATEFRARLLGAGAGGE